MVSKKNLLIMGVAVIGGLGVASMMSQDGGAGEARYRPMPGQILGSTPAVPAAAPSIINIPAESFTGFPAPTAMPAIIKRVLEPTKTIGSVSSRRGRGGGSRSDSLGGVMPPKKTTAIEKTPGYFGIPSSMRSPTIEKTPGYFGIPQKMLKSSKKEVSE